MKSQALEKLMVIRTAAKEQMAPRKKNSLTWSQATPAEKEVFGRLFQAIDRIRRRLIAEKQGQAS